MSPWYSVKQWCPKISIVEALKPSTTHEFGVGCELWHWNYCSHPQRLWTLSHVCICVQGKGQLLFFFFFFLLVLHAIYNCFIYFFFNSQGVNKAPCVDIGQMTGNLFIDIGSSRLQCLILPSKAYNQVVISLAVSDWKWLLQNWKWQSHLCFWFQSEQRRSKTR